MCESCVCNMDPYCCQAQWDSLCVDECQFQCGGCVSMLNCGDGQCQPGEGETCTTCKEDCACAPGESCFKGKCCTGSCVGKECGDDGCGGMCGKCPCPGCSADETLCSLDGQCVQDTASPCKKFMLCLMTCQDDWCMDGCFQQVGPDGMAQYQTWMDCMMMNGVEECYDSACAFVVWQSCLAEFNACTQGTMPCPVVAECMFGCGQDGQCGNACLLEGSAEANDALWKFLICAFEGCGGGEFDAGCIEKMSQGQCSTEYGACVGSCSPKCDGKECGADGCGGECGKCEEGSACLPDGNCETVCEPQCEEKECGPDGCGGKCGGCDEGEHCTPVGQCEPDCQPDCEGKECGPDGCDGTCGDCVKGETCSGFGLCIPLIEPHPESQPEVVEADKDIVETDLAEVASPEGDSDLSPTDAHGPESAVTSSTSCAGCATTRPQGGLAPVLVVLLASLIWACARLGASRRTRP